MPRWPLESIITPTPPATVTPLIPAMYVLDCLPPVPIRIVLASPATPTLPISILLLPVVRCEPAERPKAMLLLPVVLLASAALPKAVLALPVVLPVSAETPVAVLLLPVALLNRACVPVAVLFAGARYHAGEVHAFGSISRKRATAAMPR